MNKLTVILFIILSFSFSLNAQQYKTGLGLRGGLANGITVKHFIGKKAAIEGILSSRWAGFGITGLYEMHYPAFDTKGFYWYWGGGGHIGVWDGHDAAWADDDKSYTVIGADGILGLEYNFTEIPLNISVDWKPAINFVGHSGFWYDGGGISIRYLFR